jgi:phosphohistidine phosphatase
LAATIGCGADAVKVDACERGCQAQPLTMRTLHLLRHAKSSWDEPRLDDHDRPLSGRGRKAAPAMGEWMAAHGVAPELILVSTARRTQETLKAILPHLGGSPEVESEEVLYLATADELLARLRKLPATRREVMLIGHNPGLHELALLLAEPGDSAEHHRLKEKFPTAALASLESSASWSSLKPRSMRLARCIRPENVIHKS